VYISTHQRMRELQTVLFTLILAYQADDELVNIQNEI